MPNVLSPSELDQLADQVAERVASRLANQPLLVDRRRLSQIVGLSVATIERRTKAGAIPVVRDGRRVLYSPADVVQAMSAKGEAAIA